MNSTHFDGIKIVYRSYGSGDKALVFIHGWSCSSSLWHLQAPLLQKYRSLLIDLPGHGESEAPHIEYSQELFARAVEAILGQEGVTRAVMVAHSMGGPVSTMLLRLFPDRVSAIIYVDSFLHIPENYLTGAQRGELALRHQDDEKFEAMLDLFWTTQTTSATRSLVTKTMMATARHVRVNAVTTNALPHAIRWDEVFQIPALLLATPTLADIDLHWLRHVPQLKVQVWGENGHFLFMEDPVRFNEEVENFLAEHALLKQGQLNAGRCAPAP
ncbi:hypothetical protein MMC08_006661 [Hypocenomyce scalaris]|nr:hypothetical protein [Hypocenomyce scalaris]